MQGSESGDDGRAIGIQAEAFALIEPFSCRDVATLAVAALAGRHFVFEPRRATFDAGYEMFGGGAVHSDVDGTTAPDALVAVALENVGHSAATVELPRGRFCRHVSQFCHGAICRSRSAS